MDTLEIEKILNSDPGLKDSFLGVFASDQLPVIEKYPSCLVVNTDPHDKQGLHWIAINFTVDHTGEYFCSYGRPPWVRSIKDFMKKNADKIVINKKCVQTPLSSVCGQWCIFYLVMRYCEFPMRIVEIANDCYVAAFVNTNFNVVTTVYDTTYVVRQLCASFLK